MSNDSSVAGYLTPAVAPQPLEDSALIAFFQAIFVGITGLPGNMVRPRWQPNPPTMLSNDTDWMAIGVQDRKADTFAVEAHETPIAPAADTDVIIRHERLEVLCSIYGPNAENNAALIREGLQVAQNREQLQLNYMALVETGDTTTVPALVNTQWYNRLDMTVTFRRLILRVYNVLDLRSASGQIVTDIPPITRPFQVTHP